MTDEEVLTAMADLVEPRTSYILAIQRRGEPAPTVMHTCTDDAELATSLRNMARALEGDA